MLSSTAIPQVGSLPKSLPLSRSIVMPPTQQTNPPTVLVTRPAAQASSLVKAVREIGAEALTHPVIEIVPVDDQQALIITKTLKRMDQFDTMVFASVNGVEHFHRALKGSHTVARSTAIPDLSKFQFVAIGKATAASIERHFGVTPAISPTSNSNGMAAFLNNEFRSDRLLIFRANRGSDELGRALASLGIVFEELVIYESRDVKHIDASLVEKLDAGKIDWITLTSSAIANSAFQVFQPWLSNDADQKIKIASISPTTSAVIRRHGREPDAEAKSYDMVGLVEALRKRLAEPV